MKICHILSGDLWAGAEVMSHRLLSELRRLQDVELAAIVLNEGRLAEELRKEGIPVRILDESACGFFELARRVRKAVADIAPDLIHSHRVKENILAYLAAGNGKRIPLVCTQHGMPEPASSLGNRFRKAIIGRIHRAVLGSGFRSVVAVSGEMRRLLMREFGLPEEKVACIPNGTGLPGVVSAKPDREGIAIGSAGRFFPVKDYGLMVDVARELSKRDNGVVFHLAGEGPEKEDILRRIREYGLGETFRLSGFLEDMDGFYARLDIYINTSIHEGMPMSVLEAMAHGVPVVAPDCGGFAEMVVDGEQGYLVACRDPRAFAEKCLRLIDDGDLRRRMGESARERVRGMYSGAGMARSYHDLYRRILG